MPFFTSLLIASAAIFCASAAVGTSLLPPAIPSPNLEGYSDGFYYLASSSNYPSANISLVNGPAGQFDFTWVSNNWQINAGKGWNPGSRDRIINYRGAYQPNGVSYLWVHGWTTNPLIEYFIVESNNGAEGHPYSAAFTKGSASCNGGTYEVRNGTRWDIRVDGVLLPVPQFWSIRTRSVYPSLSLNGTVNTTCHFDAWKKYGMQIGTDFDYQVLSVDSVLSRGFANLTVTDITVSS